MISNLEKYWDGVGQFILKLTYPHEHNDHQPWILRSHGLLLFLVILISTQVFANLASQSDRILGFASNISVSEVINLTNQERTSGGLPALQTNVSLNKAAAQKAAHMFEQDYWAHFAPDGTSPWYFFNLVSYKYTWAGENLARDFATSSGVVTAWMESSGHKANILNNNFSEIGVAVVNGNLGGEDTTLVVQLFGKPLGVASADSQPSGESRCETASASKVSAQLKLPVETNETTAVESTGEKAAVNNQTSSNLKAGLPIVSLVKNSTNSQKVTISLLALIGALFGLDSFVIYRRRHLRSNSHSLSHASMIVLLIIITLLYGRGTIL